MITQALGAVGRHRRVVLGAGLVLAAGYLVIHLWIPSPGRRAFPAMAVATAVLLLLSVVATARPRPQSFVVDPAARAFRTPPQPAFVFVALAFLPLATGMAGNVVRDRGSEPFLPDQLVELGYAVVLILWVVIAWRDDSVQLRPDGVWQRGITGWLVIPWDAAPAVPAWPPAPDASTVRLTYGRPDLVRRHGLHLFRHLRTQDVDPRFLTAAIGYYAAHPEHRAAIGTRAEYERVAPHLRTAPDRSPRPV